ncbi:MAG: alpha/beta hydrolase [Candidatus Heimdallarchaeota archaeon]
MSIIHEEITFESEGNVLVGNLLFPTEKKYPPPYPAVIYFHGFPGNADKVSGVGLSLVRMGYAYLAFDFQGIRLSGGEFSLAGEIQNAKEAIDFIRSQDFTEIDIKRIGVYGESLGGAVAICTSAMRKDIQLTVVRAPVYDTVEFFDFPWIPDTFRALALDMPDEVRGLEKTGKLAELKAEANQPKFNPMEAISKISPRKVFILASGQDNLIPIEGVRKLFAKAQKPRILKVQPFADHNLSSHEFYQEAVGIVTSWIKERL